VVRVIVRRPRNDDEPEYSGYEVHHLLMSGGADTNEADDGEEHREARRQAVARKRPVGFAPWPEEES
jgi:hypothetical protein